MTNDSCLIALPNASVRRITYCFGVDLDGKLWGYEEKINTVTKRDEKLTTGGLPLITGTAGIPGVGISLVAATAAACSGGKGIPGIWTLLKYQWIPKLVYHKSCYPGNGGWPGWWNGNVGNEVGRIAWWGIGTKRGIINGCGL